MLSAVNFFSIEWDCFQKRTPLPDTSPLTGEEPFAELSMSWSREGLTLWVIAEEPIVAVQLYIDTRDIKSAGFNHRFCHHFLFTAEGAANEITRFRTEDTHPLAEPKLLVLKMKSNKWEITIPAQALFGFNPDEFDRLGFTYLIERNLGPAQHFSLLSSEYTLDQMPALWSSVKLL